ncbi:transcription elongation factor [Methylobacterium sp. Leaf399]|uniref:transcription elongation factor GreA n=1 Tax=unclassified Methylobacterium TaxID=2615210 RepID=UPI0006FC87CA|nr:MULTISPECIES: transcription elongation factor GreA [unclassified Methylobacterium]KQP51280.1 transcription elongation factor [Methylobacterium sp. Leaf108]KQT13779.1 transcription elongation factor [Methylobacterium sp. Leaf399]KQT77756.1 transcription elongation factor [Methylobacterium sp. Leaf466]
MSQAFVREPEGGEAFEDLPDRPISPHTNFVTPEGLAQIEAEVARHQADFAALGPDDKADTARITRDLHYWTARLGTAELVAPTPSDEVRFGSRVEIEREDGTKQSYRIVGEDEADPAQGSIAYVSPMAKALTGKTVGDTVEVNGHEVEITAVG